MSSSIGGNWPPSAKYFFGYIMVRAVDAFLRYSPRFVPAGAYENPLVWWTGAVVIMAIWYALTPKMNAWDTAHIGYDVAYIVGGQAISMGVVRYLELQGYDLAFEPAPWRSDAVLCIVPLVLAGFFIRREAPHGVRS